jgi:hypothetical protein
VSNIACYVCGRKAEGWDKADLYNVNCPKCANYALKDLAFRSRLIRGVKKALKDDERERLSKAVKSEYEKSKRRVSLSTAKIDKLVGRPQRPNRVNLP